MIHRFKTEEIEEAIEALRQFVDESIKTEFVLEVKVHRRKRSLAQNAYYWGVVLKVLGQHIGDSAEALHKDMASRFLPHMIRYPNGEMRIVPGQTSESNTLEFSQYIEKIRNFAQTTLGCYIPEPNEVTEEMLQRIHNEYERMF